MRTGMTELIDVHSGEHLLAEVSESMPLTTEMTLRFLVVVRRSGMDDETHFYKTQPNKIPSVFLSLLGTNIRYKFALL